MPRKESRGNGSGNLLLDDGFQYWKSSDAIKISFSIDATNPFGYGHGLPRGLLREPLDALSRASLFILTKSDQVHLTDLMEIREERRRLAPGVPVLSSTHAPSKVVPYEKWKAFLHEGTLEDVRMK